MFLVNHAIKKLSFMSVYSEEQLFSSNRDVAENISESLKLAEKKTKCEETSSESIDTKKVLKKIFYLKRENYGHLTAITRNVATMKKDREIISSRVLNVLYADGEYEAKKFNNINNSS